VTWPERMLPPDAEGQGTNAWQFLCSRYNLNSSAYTQSFTYHICLWPQTHCYGIQLLNQQDRLSSQQLCLPAQKSEHSQCTTALWLDRCPTSFALKHTSETHNCCAQAVPEVLLPVKGSCKTSKAIHASSKYSNIQIFKCINIMKGTTLPKSPCITSTCMMSDQRVCHIVLSSARLREYACTLPPEQGGKANTRQQQSIVCIICFATSTGYGNSIKMQNQELSVNKSTCL
jgi:hypothetical protein